MKLTQEELHDRYWVQGQSCVDIARDVGRDPTTVRSWMKSYGMETRGRGQDTRQHFKHGHKLCVGRLIPTDMREKLRQARLSDGSKGLFKPNGDHVLKGRRGAEIHSWKGGVTPERQAFYASEEWKEACRSVWQRADAKCEKCGLDHRHIDRDAMKFHVHHVASFAKHPERRADPENLKLLCAPCHRWVHSNANTENLFLGASHEEA